MRLYKYILQAPALKGGIRYSHHMAIVLLCLFFSFQPTRAQDRHGDWGEIASLDQLKFANYSYTKGEFEKAAESYEHILSIGYESPELYFNLGNSYFKLDKVGLSILNYERAKKLAPYDPDLNFNLKLANQRTLDKTESLPQPFFEEWWGNLTNMQSEKTWGIRSICAFMIFLFFLGVFITSNKIFTKQLGFWLSILFLIFSVSSFFISKSSYNNMKNRDSAVILSSSVEVKNSPAEGGKKLFILHEGTKVSVPQDIKTEEGEWVVVQLSPEKVGWVKRSAIEFI